MESLRSFWDGVTAFVDALGSVAVGALLAAVGFHLLNLVLRTRGWRNILAAAYPHETVRWRQVFGAYTAGVGVNAIVPARGGDLVKLFLVHRSVRGSTYPTIGSSLLAETTFDALVGALLITWALTLGIAPELPDLPSLPVFEFSWMARHPLATGIIVIVVIALGLAALILAQHRLRAFWQRVEQGLTILRMPRRYAREVVTYQALGWTTRVLTAYFFLQAFHVPATLRNALLILVVQAVGTLMPVTPGGVGPKQALLVVLLAGEAARSDVLALSVGMEVAIILANLVVGMASLTLMVRGVGLRGAVAHARAGASATRAVDPDAAPTAKRRVPRP